ncbi:Dot/Icm T4SS effector Zinc-dependent metalloprotease LegP [Cryobacterium psychrophilum]|nr:Dot/Icm T4SS effector Zinc-dependent metalloprotease LegP [Cryobacterium psychrophilum]TDW28638.1 repeat uncharacterized protein DUF346 [Cryobacterium psychrophilum]
MNENESDDGLGVFTSEGEFQAEQTTGTAVISGVNLAPTEVTYHEVDGLAVFEGDIVLGTVAEMQQTKDAQGLSADEHARAVIIPGARFRWPNSQVPFQINAALPNQQRVRDAIAHWEARTPIRFPERTPANAAQFPNFVEFSDAGGCWSRLGMQGNGRQTISLGSDCTTGNAIHEIGHTVGLWHEQSREDRDTFVTINRQNISPGMESQFDQHIVDGDDVGAYDYGSIMHYPRTAFSKNGLETITPVQAGVQIGQRTALSAGDIAAVDFMYPSTPRASSGPVVSWGPNRIDAFVLGTNRAVFHKWWNGANWGPSVTGYENMGGIAESVPQAVAWAPNRLDLFVTGTDSALYHKWWNGSAWGPSATGYEYMGGVCLGDPRIVSWGPNRLDVFVVGSDRGLYHKWFNGAWGPSVTGYEAMGGGIIGQPEVASWGPNRLDVFVIGTDRALYHKWWNGAAWGPSLTGYERLGGVCMSSPRVVSWGPDRLDVFVTGTDGALYHKWWNGSAWGPSINDFERMGGVCVGEPEVVAWGPNRLDVFVIGTDSALHHKWWNGSAWGPSLTGYENMGGIATSQPRVVSWAPNRLDVFLTGTNSALFHKWFNGSAWGPSLTGYESLGGVITAFDEPEQKTGSDSLHRDTD